MELLSNDILLDQLANTELIIDELKTLNNLNINLINNSIEQFKVLIIFIGVIFAILVSTLFIKMVYKNV